MYQSQKAKTATKGIKANPPELTVSDSLWEDMRKKMDMSKLAHVIILQI